MSCRNFYWVFITNPSNVWVSFNQIQNMIETAKISEDTKAIALVSELILCRYLKSSAYSYEEEYLPKTYGKCCSLPQVMFEWVSTKPKVWLKLTKSIKTPRLSWCLNWCLPIFQIIGLLIWRRMSCRNFYWVFINNPINVWVSFNQIRNMIEIGEIN